MGKSQFTVLLSVCGILLLGCLATAVACACLDARKDKSLFLFPTKTASRAIQRGLGACLCKNSPDMAMNHSVAPSSLAVPYKDYYIVLRHPYERAMSAFAFKKQGGENRDEMWGGLALCADTAKVAKYDTLEDMVLANPDMANLPLMAPRHQYVTYFKPDKTGTPVHPICYPDLATTWPSLLQRFGCCPDCDLPVSNTSNSKAQMLGPATKAYIDTHLAGDLAIYEKYCGPVSNNV